MPAIMIKMLMIIIISIKMIVVSVHEKTVSRKWYSCLRLEGKSAWTNILYPATWFCGVCRDDAWVWRQCHLSWRKTPSDARKEGCFAIVCFRNNCSLNEKLGSLPVSRLKEEGNWEPYKLLHGVERIKMARISIRWYFLQWMMCMKLWDMPLSSLSPSASLVPSDFEFQYEFEFVSYFCLDANLPCCF